MILSLGPIVQPVILHNDHFYHTLSMGAVQTSRLPWTGAKVASMTAHERCLKEVDKRLGVSRRTYAGIWWALALWNSCAVFNIWSRTQEWGIALPLAPDFGKTATPYAVAAIGGLFGALTLWLVLIMLQFYAVQWGRCSDQWRGRIPAVGTQVEPFEKGQLIPVIQCTALAVAIIFPLAGQVHFVDKFLGGTSRVAAGGVYANDWRGHLMNWISPASACRDFTYDGQDGFSYCEFFEPWALCIFAVISFLFAATALRAVFFGVSKKSQERAMR
jgi:hypothetical protein